MEHKGGIQGASFCKIKFVEVQGRVAGFRRLDHALAKLGWSVHAMSAKKDAMRGYYLVSRIRSLAAQYPKWNRMQDYAAKIVQVCYEKYNSNAKRYTIKKDD